MHRVGLKDSRSYAKYRYTARMRAINKLGNKLFDKIAVKNLKNIRHGMVLGRR